MKKFPFKAIENILKDTDSKYHHINQGGCGVMASILASHLKNVTDIRIVSFGGDGNIDEARNHVNKEDNNCREWWEHNIHFYHVWVEFKWNTRWYAIDSAGIHSRSLMYRLWGKPCPGSFTLEEMKQLSEDSRGWNAFFPRKQIPGMKNFVGRHFNKLFREVGVIA